MQQTEQKTRSALLFEEAQKLFPGGVNSPVRAFRSVEGSPIFIEKGKGSRIWDADGKEYLDFCCSWGPLILGHADDEVVKAIAEVAASGTSFGAPTRLENQLAELILSNNRFLEKIRFVSSGTEAVMSAIRLARGYTGRNKIIKFEGCYHGHVDHLLVKAGSGLVTFGETSSAGVPPSFAAETIVLPLNDSDALETAFARHGKDIACIAIEPVPANNGLLLQRREFLLQLRQLCDQYGTLLLFDEVISGFRLGFEGAAGFYDIRPDIVCYGKIIGGGMPVGAYGASAAIMAKISPEGPVYQAGTLSGNPVAMMAGYVTLSRLLKPGFYTGLEAKTQQFANLVNRGAENQNLRIRMQTIGSIFWLAFSGLEPVRRADAILPEDVKPFAKIHRQLLNDGIYLGPSAYEVGFVSAAHREAELAEAAEKMVNALTGF